MRFSLCYRVVRLKGFFWGRRLFLYRRRFSGFLSPSGAGLQPRGWLWRLGDGFWGIRGFRFQGGHRQYGLLRVRNAGYIQFRLLSPRIEPFWPAAWASVRYLYTRHCRGRRYRLGLPAHGQRTHSNAATTRRVTSAVVSYIRSRYWFRKLWEPRKGKGSSLKAHQKSQSRRATKAERHKRGVVRTKQAKKKDVWR